MHIRIWSAQAVGPMKWRGAALSDFDGKRWTNPSRRAEMIPVENEHVVLAPIGLRPPGRRINYRVDLEALENDTLFFAGTPETLDLRARALYRYEGFQFSPRPRHSAGLPLRCVQPSGRPAGNRARCSFRLPYFRWPLASSTCNCPPSTAASPNWRAPLPPGPPAIWRARDPSNAICAPTTPTPCELPDREMADPLANFLFARRKGHCEYFASSMAVMLRSLGIPARLATGFQSGVYNPVSDLWLVRASDAHSWVEAWIPGYGWKTFDPTPADPNAGGLALLTRLALYLDASETFWQEWVVTYDLVRQGTLAYRMEQGAQRLGIRWFDTAASLRSGWKRFGAGWARRFGWQSLVWVAALVALGFAAGPLLRLMHIRRRVERVRRGQASVADATVLYQRMLHILKRRGYQKPLWFTPAEFAASLPPTPLGKSVGEFTATYNALRFGGHAEAAPILSILLDRMERQ